MSIEKNQSESSSEYPELDRLVGPLLRHRAVTRLKGITFLGILSPRYREIAFTYPKQTLPGETDGTRFDHSIGVASLLVDFCRRLGLNRMATVYAGAYGLLHDVATWPLSHTSEPAFVSMTGVSSKYLREMLIRGSSKLPGEFDLAGVFRQLEIEPHVLMELFSSSPATELFSSPHKTDLSFVHQLVRSPVTPDTLEGIWRAGRAFGICVPPPHEVIEALSRDLYGMFIEPPRSVVVMSFWRRKAEIYRRFINHPHQVRRESFWCQAIAQTFKSLDIGDSLFLTEEDLIDRARGQDVQETAGMIVRYKPPRVYTLCAGKEPRMEHPKRKKRRVFARQIALDDLGNILTSEVMRDVAV